MDVQNVIGQLLETTGWSQQRLADEINSTQNNVSRWLKGREPRGRNMESIRTLAIKYGVLDEPAVERSYTVPVMGYVGASGGIETEGEPPPPDGYGQVTIPFTMPDAMIAFEVRGDSMYPAYEPGEIIVCLRDQQHDTDWFLGRTAIVRTDVGERWLKRITRGRRLATYTLHSWNAESMEDIHIAWVGEIIASVKSVGVRRLAKAASRNLKRRGK